MIDQYYPGGEDSDHFPRQAKGTKKSFIFTKLIVKEDRLIPRDGGGRRWLICCHPEVHLI